MSEDRTYLRPVWDSYFLMIAKVVATRATCDRKHVGAVIVSPHHQILSTGYNGSPPGALHCDDVGHELKEMGGRMSCVRTVHSEANAIAQAARNGVNINGSIIYTTASPCYDCGKLIASSGIKKVVYGEQYDSRYGMSNDVAAFLTACGIDVVGFTVTWRPYDGPSEVEKAVAAERERNVEAIRRIVDVVLAAQPELGRAFVVDKFRTMLSDASLTSVIGT